MLINLSDVLSDQHKTVEETVRLEMEEIRLQSGTYPIISKEPVHVKVEHIRGKELLKLSDNVHDFGILPSVHLGIILNDGVAICELTSSSVYAI